jgi:hypothetical protein
VLVTSLTRRIFGDDGRIHSDLGDYVAGARSVAIETGAPLVDLHQLSVDALNRVGPAAAASFNAAKADGSPDTTHLSAEGSKVFGGIVADELARVVPALASSLTAGSPARDPRYPPAGTSPGRR